MPAAQQTGPPSGRNAAIAVVSILAVVLAIFVIYRTWKAGQPINTKVLNTPGMAMKVQAMKARDAAQGGAQQAPIGEPNAAR